MSFRYVINAALVSGLANTVVSPQMTPRATTEADGWCWYRVKALKFRLFSLTNSATAGFVEGVPDSLPSTIASVNELLRAVQHQGSTETTWSNWVKVSATSLAGALPWYKTVPGSATEEEEVAGTIAIAGTGTNTFSLEFFVTFEFKGPVATVNTPAMVDLQVRMRAERQRAAAIKRRDTLLADLGPTPSLSPTK